MIGETVNPLAIAAIEKGAREAGYRTIFGPTADEFKQTDVALMHHENMYGIERKGFLSPLSLPSGNEGFYLVDPKYLPPVPPDALKFLNPEHPVYARMQKLLELQNMYAKPDGQVEATVVAHIFCIKDENIRNHNVPSILLPARNQEKKTA